MIQALQHHKTNIRFIEDERTSMIIGTLLHLPTAFTLEIIFNAIGDKPSILKNKTKEHLQKMPEFWPHWSAKGTSNEHHVEPDVFMRFGSFDLIIETKKDDDKTSQYSNQLNNELIAYENEYGKEDKKVYLIALGGNTDDIESVNEKRRNKILICRWYNLLNSIEKEIRKTLKETKYFTDNNKYRILLDCKNAFDLLGYPTSWLYDMCDLEYESINIESIKEIKSWKI